MPLGTPRYHTFVTLRTISSRHSIAGTISRERCQLNLACSDGGILRTVPIDAFDAIQNSAGSSGLTLALTIMRGGDANVRQGGKAQVEEMGSLLFFLTGLIETMFSAAPFGAEIEGSSYYDSSAYPKAMVNIDVSAVNVVDMNLCQDNIDFMTAEGYNDVADWLIAEDKATVESFKIWRRQRRTYSPCSQTSRGAVEFVTEFIPWLFTHYFDSDDIMRDTGHVINNAHVILVLALLVLPGIKPRELWSVCWHCYQQQLSTKRLRNYLRQHLFLPACFLTILALCVVYLCYVSNLPEIFILVRIPSHWRITHSLPLVLAQQPIRCVLGFCFMSCSACESLPPGEHFCILASARYPRISNWNHGCACVHNLIVGTVASNTGSRCWDCHKQYSWVEGRCC